MKAVISLVLTICAIVHADPLPYPLYANGSQIVGPDGVPVRLAGVGMSWGLDFITTYWNLSYKDVFSFVAQGGINTIRLTTIDNWVLNNVVIPDLNYDANPDLQGLGVQETLQTLVDYGNSVGLKFIIESHLNEPDEDRGNQANGLWYDLGGASDNTDGNGIPGTISDATFLAVWQIRAKLFAGNPGVIGYDIRNEPQSYPGACTWGDNSDTDILSMYERVGNAILAIDPDKLIICEGTQNYGGSFANVGNAPWGDLSAVGILNLPVQLNVSNKVVYSIHNYPTEVSGYSPDAGADLVQQIDAVYGYLITQNIAPVWIGECGTNMQTQDAQTWGDTFVSWMNGNQGANGGPTFSGNQQGVSWSWWDLTPVFNGSNNFGMLNPDGTGFDPQQEQYWGQMLPN